MTITDLIGSIGVGILLLAYLLNLLGKIAADSVAYCALNCLGAALACLASVLLRYWPFIILEIVWFLVSLYGLLRRPPGSKIAD